MPLAYDRIQRIQGQLCGRLGKIGMVVDGGQCVLPVAVVKVGRKKAVFRHTGVIAFRKLGIVSVAPGLRVAAVAADQEGGIGIQNGGVPVEQGADQPLPVVAADPNAVAEPLVVGVDRDDVFSRVQTGGQVDCIVVVMLRVSRRGTLCHKGAVDIQFIIVIRADVQCVPVCAVRQGKGAAEQQMAVKLRFRLAGKRFVLPVENVLRRTGGKVAVGYQLCATERMHRKNLLVLRFCGVVGFILPWCGVFVKEGRKRRKRQSAQSGAPEVGANADI